MKKLLVIGFLFACGLLKSQCLQIQSILVDACATSSNEPLSEMVRFKNGNLPLSISQISIAGAGSTGVFQMNKWPNTTLSWFGLVQTAQTASVTAQFQATVASGACGKILEPPAGVIPANATVIMVCSEYPAVSLNNFTNLNDTIYMVYQDTVSSVSSGHFANYSAGSGNRSLIIFDNQHGCSDTATYDKSLLVNQAGGFSAQDGATVLFGATTQYINNGCSAPYVPLGVDAGNSQTVCQLNSVNLSATTTGSYSTASWSGGAGTFSNSNSLNPTYTPATTETGTVTLYVTISSTCGTSVNDSVTITVNPLPTATVSSSSGNTICEGQSTTLTASGGSSYNWQPGNLTTSSISASSETTYSVSVTNSCGTANATFSLDVDTVPAVNISASGSTSICPGNSVTLTAAGASTYNWNSGQSTNSISVSSAGFYYATGSNNCGSDSAGISVSLIPTPTVAIASASTVFCSTDSLQLSASTQAGNTVTWQPGNIQNNTFTATAAGTYTATAQNTCGLSSDQITLQTESPLNISASSSAGNNICNGSSTTLSASGGSSYMWSTGQTSSTITVNASGNYFVFSGNACGNDTAFVNITVDFAPSVTINASVGAICPSETSTLYANYSLSNSVSWSTGSNADSIVVNTPGTYYAVANNNCGNDTAFYTINASIYPAISVSTSADTICPGQNATLTATSNVGVTWSTGSSSNQITVNNGGSYFAVASTACGSDTAAINVISLAIPDVAASSSSTVICPSQTITLAATESAGNSLTWSDGTVGDTLLIANAGTYYVYSANNCGSDTAAITVSAVSNPTISITSSADTICPGQSAVLTAFSNATTNWSTGSGASQISVSSGGNYFVIASNACGSDTASMNITALTQPSVSVSSAITTICSGQSVTIVATYSGTNNVMWQDNSLNDSITVSTTGTYFAAVSNYCGTDTAFITITSDVIPSVSLTASQSLLCPGQSATLTATSNTNVTWSTGASTSQITVSSPGNYFVIAANNCGADTASAIITSQQLPAVAITASNDTICQGQTATLTANLTGSSNVTWQNGSTANSISAANSGTYFAVTSNACGTDTAFMTITSVAMPLANISASDLILCPGETSTLTASGIGNFIWIPGGNAGAINVSQGGTYLLVAQNSCGTDTSSVIIQQSSVTAQFSATPPMGVYPLNVDFGNSSTGATNYIWDFGNGSGAITANASNVFSTPGNYTVTLVVSNTDGCSDTAQAVITVLLSEPFINVPNIFSPNGDNINDKFDVEHYAVTDFHIEITDRWGLKMFESADITKSWDGRTLKGEPAAEGTYFFMAGAKGIDGKELKVQGFLMLVK